MFLVAYQAACVSTVKGLFHASTAHEGVQRRLDFQETAGQSQRAAAEKDMDRAGITSFVTDLTRCHLLIIVDEKKKALAAIFLGM